jgi:hypothetical protein
MVGSILPPRERPRSGHPPSRRPAARRVGCVGTRRLHHAVARRSAARPDPLGRERRRERPHPPRRAGLEEGSCACALRAAGRAAVAFLVGAPGCRPRVQPRRRSGGAGTTADRGRRVEGCAGGTRGDHPSAAGRPADLGAATVTPTAATRADDIWGSPHFGREVPSEPIDGRGTPVVDVRVVAVRAAVPSARIRRDEPVAPASSSVSHAQPEGPSEGRRRPDGRSPKDRWCTTARGLTRHTVRRGMGEKAAWGRRDVPVAPPCRRGRGGPPRRAARGRSVVVDRTRAGRDGDRGTALRGRSGLGSAVEAQARRIVSAFADRRAGVPCESRARPPHDGGHVRWRRTARAAVRAPPVLERHAPTGSSPRGGPSGRADARAVGHRNVRCAARTVAHAVTRHGTSPGGRRSSERP